MYMIRHDDVCSDMMSALFEMVKPFIDKVIRIRHLKQRYPLVICKREKVQALFPDMRFYYGHCYEKI